MKKLFQLWPYMAILAALCLFHPREGFAQQGGTITSVTFGPMGTPKGGVTVTVCASSAAVVNGVCTPAESDANCCFTDGTLTVRVTPPPSGGTVLSNGLGNYTVWAAPGQYHVSYSGPGVNATDQLVPVACMPGSGGTCGVITSAANTWTAAQNFDADFHNKGPNPWADVTRFGGYFSAIPSPSTTGAITSGTAALTLGSAQDFANTQGILILGAGPAPTITTPTGLTVLNGGPAGTTTYNYVVVAEDYNGGRTASSTSAAITTGVATLGIQTVTGITCNRASGLSTCTKTAHGFQVGYPVNVTATNSNSFEGVFTVTAVTANTFTYNQYSFPDSTGVLTSGTAQQVGFNRLRWNSDATNTVLRWYIYRCTATCGVVGPNYALAGVAIGVDGYFEDRGFAMNAALVGNGDVPATAPTTASNDWFSTTISNGGGTTALTLAANATTTVAGATVLHDNSPNIVQACASLAPTKGGTVYIPDSNVAANYFPINSTLNMSACGKQTQLLIANKVWQNATIIPFSWQNFKGAPSGNDSNSTAFYQLRPVAQVIGYAYPFTYLPGNPSMSGDSWDDLLYFCTRPYQTCHYNDMTTGGSSSTSERFNHVHFNGTGGQNTPLVIKGGFGWFFDYGGWSTGATNFSGPPAALFSMNCGLGNTPGFISGPTTTNTYIFGGVVFDSCMNGGSNQITDPVFRDTLIEGSYVPFIRTASTGLSSGTVTIAGLDIIRPAYADQVGGMATPVIDLSFGGIRSLRVTSPAASNLSPIVSVPSLTKGGIELNDVPPPGGGSQYGPGAVTYTQKWVTGLNAELYANTALLTNGLNGGFVFQMATPSPAQSAVVSAGGSVPVGTHAYAIAAQDYSSNYTVISAAISATTTGGNQTVTITLPATFPAGAKGVFIFRDNTGLNCSILTTPGGTYIDTLADGARCGQSPSGITLAGQTIIDANGVATTALRLTGTADASIATLKLPQSAGFVSSANSSIGIDTTANMLKAWDGVDNFGLLMPATTIPAAGDLAVYTVSGSQYKLSNIGRVGGGTNPLFCSNTPSALNGDFFHINGSGVCVPVTPGVPGRTATTATEPILWTPGTGDRGGLVTLTNAALVTSAIPQCGVAPAVSNPYTTIWGTGAAGFKITSTTSTINGIAGATGITYPGNTRVDITCPDNANYTALASRAVKAGTNATETLNPDGTVSINVPAGGGSSVWSALTAPVANLSLAMGGNLTTFSTTTALAQIMSWKNATAAVVGTSQGSPLPAVCGRAWTGADAEDCMTWQDLPGNGVNAPITFQFLHTGTSTGQIDTTFPGPVKSTGTTAGFTIYTQNPTSAAVEPCNNVNTICEQAPVVVASYLVTKPGVAAQGLVVGTLSGSTITQGFSGDSNHSATVTIGSGTSISSTQLCSSANCPAGTYAVSVYLDITTACGTTGTYIVNLIYTDDQGAKTVPVNINGTGAVPATGSLTTTSTANFGENNQIIRLASGTINYSTTATACGTAGPMVGKLYLAAVPVM